MSRMFISHSSANNDAAWGLRVWLRQNGWDDVFLDVDAERGIAAGERWERALNEAASRCEAVLFVISMSWLRSVWCLKEFHLARRLNKQLFGVLVEPVQLAELPEALTGAWQVVDLSSGEDHVVLRVPMPGGEEQITFSADGLARLRRGLAKAGLDPRFFAWPPPDAPDRAPYPGLKPLETRDAGIFFGRDAPVVEAMDMLRGLLVASAPRIMVIIGASGAGKSSFLRAGLLPRIGRDDRNFLVLPAIRPQSAALTGETGLIPALEAECAARGLRQSRSSIRAAVQAGTAALSPLLGALVESLFRQTLAKTGSAPHPAVVITVDQAEELFTEEGRIEGSALLELARELALTNDPAVILLFGIRSDSYDRLETALPLEGLKQHAFPLVPMPRGNYQMVIEGPAQRSSDSGRKLIFDPRLTDALLADIEKGGARDALPLLAFTLEQLYIEYGRGRGQMRLQDYQDFGGIAGAIEAAIERVFVAADGNPRIPVARDARLALLRRGLIPWLAGIDPETNLSRRRVANLSDIPAESLPLIELLVAQRLLATDSRQVMDGAAMRHETTLEPAHEALLRQWGLLHGWLQEDFAALTTLEAVKSAARDWAANDYPAEWLNHSGGRLEDAEAVAARPDLITNLSADAHNYLRSCRARDDAMKAEREAALLREEQRLKEIAAAQHRTAKLQRIFFRTLAVAAMIIGGGGVVLHRNQTKLHTSQANLEKSYVDLHIDQIALAHGRTALAYGETNLLTELALEAQSQGNFDRAFRFAVLAAAQRLQLPPGGPLETLPGVTLAAVASATREQIVLPDQAGDLNAAAFSPDGTRVVTVYFHHEPTVWNAVTGQQIAILQGHNGSVVSAAFSPEGTRIVTASWDRTARVWNAATGRQTAILQGHKYWVDSAVFSPDGTRIVTTSYDHTARVWNAVTGQPISVLAAGHNEPVIAAAFSPDSSRIVTGSYDGTAGVWNATTGQQITILNGHNGPVDSTCFNRDGTRIVTASKDGTARVWDAGTGRPIAILKRHMAFVRSAVFSPDGARIVTGADDDTARVWNAVTGQQIAILQGNAGPVNSAVFSPDGSSILTASSDGTARIWDAGTGQQLAILQSSLPNSLLFAAFSRDGTRILTAGSDGTARVWNTDAGQQIAVLQGHKGPVTSATFSPDGTRILTASKDFSARTWNGFTGQLLDTLQSPPGRAFSAAFSPDGTRVVMTSGFPAFVLDAARARLIAVFQAGIGPVDSASFNRDGTRIVSVTDGDKYAWIWNANTGKPITVLRLPSDFVKGTVKYAAFSPDGTRIFTAAGYSPARVWNAVTGQPIAVLQGDTETANSAVFSPDGTRIVAVTGYSTAPVWNAATGQEIAILQSETDSFKSAAFSRDGTRIVTAGDYTAQVWDATTGRQAAILQGDTGAVNAVAFNRDGTRLVTASDDGTARIWDAATGELITTLQGQAPVNAAAFSPDGARVVTGSNDKTARIWNVRIAAMATKDLIAEICTHQLLGISTMTRDEIKLAALPETTSLIDVCSGVN